MKIGYVIRSLEDSGVTVYTLRLADAMRRRGHDVFLVSDTGMYSNEVARLNLRHYTLSLCRDPLTSYLAARRLAKVVAPERPDILHGNWRRAQLACHLTEKKLGIPFVTTLHLVGIPANWLYRRLSYWGRRTIAPCSEAVTFLEKRFGVPRERIRLVHHGVDPSQWPPTTPESRGDARRDLGIDPKAPVAVCVGRLEGIKDHRTMLAALATVAESHPEFRLLLVGSGAEEQALKTEVARLHLTEQVRFLGWCDPRPALAAADVFLLTSRHESFGIAPVEAMLTGLPVVRTATEGASDQVRPGETGEIVPIGDADAVARVLLDVVTRRDEWAQRGQAAQNDALERFTEDRLAEAVEAVYEEVLQEDAAHNR